LSSALRVLAHGRELFQLISVSKRFPVVVTTTLNTKPNGQTALLKKCEAADAIPARAVGHEVDGKTVFTKPGKPYPEPQLAG